MILHELSRDLFSLNCMNGLPRPCGRTFMTFTLSEAGDRDLVINRQQEFLDIGQIYEYTLSHNSY